MGTRTAVYAPGGGDRVHTSRSSDKIGMLASYVNLALLYVSSALALVLLIRYSGVNLADHVLEALAILIALPFPLLLKQPVLRGVRSVPIAAFPVVVLGAVFWLWSPDQEWTFVDLENSERIKQDIWLEVNHPPNVQGDIWVIQQQQKNVKYFPSAKSLDTTSCDVALAPRDGTTFGFPLRVGEANQKGERFTLIIAVANRTASDALTNTLKAWCEQGRYPGLSELPSGLDIKHMVEVQRLSEP